MQSNKFNSYIFKISTNSPKFRKYGSIVTNCAYNVLNGNNLEKIPYDIKVLELNLEFTFPFLLYEDDICKMDGYCDENGSRVQYYLGSLGRSISESFFRTCGYGEPFSTYDMARNGNGHWCLWLRVLVGLL